MSCFQAPVLRVSCHVRTAGVSLRGRAATSQTTVAMEPMKRIAGLPAPLRMDAAAGGVPWLIILIGRWGRGPSRAYGLHMITL